MRDDDVLILINDEDKKCKRCGRYYPTSHFYRKESSRDGMQSWCLHCQRLYQRQRSAEMAIGRIRIMRDFKIMTLFRMLRNAPKATRNEAVRIMEGMIRILRH